MASQIVRVFEVFDNAERARTELLAAGFAHPEMEVLDDEAGPAKGNFTVGDHTRDDEPVYQRKFAPAAERGCSVVTVAAPDPIRAALAVEILERHGGAELP
jgi:hypothetical protein